MNAKAVVLAVIAVLVIIGVGYYAFTGLAVMPSEKPAIERQEVKIGVILPLTGTSSDAGQLYKKGIDLAVEEINSSPALKFKVMPIFEDSQYKPEVGVTAINKLISIDEVKFIIGDHGSSVTVAMAPIAEKNKVILITPGSQTDEISNAGDFIFRTQVSVLQETSFLAPKIKQLVGSNRVGIIALGTAYGDSIINDFSRIYPGFGGNLGLAQRFTASETDFKAYLLKAGQDNDEALLLGANRQQAGLIMRQAKELGLEFRFFGGLVMEGQELLISGGSSVEGLIYSYAYDSSQSDSTKGFAEKFSKKYGIDAEAFSANGYDSVKLLSNCFEKAGIKTTAVRDCLYATQNYAGASGILSFDSNGDVSKPFILKTVRNGKFVKLG